MTTESAAADQIAVATANIATAIVCIVLILITLSVVSECSGSVAKLILALFVVQCGIGLIVLPVSALCITSVLVSNDDANALFMDIAGYGLLVGVSGIATLQLFVSAMRYLEITSVRVATALNNNTATFVMILGAFFVGASRFLDLMLNDRTIGYNRKHLRWIYSVHWDNNVEKVISAALLLLIALYALSVGRLVGETCFRLLRHQKIGKLSVFGHLVSVTLFIAADLGYGFLLSYAHKKAMPSKFLYISVDRTFYDGFLQTFALVIWPQMVMLVTNRTMQRALCARTQQVTSEPVTPASYRAAHKRRMNKQFSVDSITSIP